jgi:K+-transporting ATPase A subunit
MKMKMKTNKQQLVILMLLVIPTTLTIVTSTTTTQQAVAKSVNNRGQTDASRDTRSCLQLLIYCLQYL